MTLCVLFKLMQVILCVIGVPFILLLLGFAPAGVVFGSFAAWWQSMIGNVAAGSLFALLQSAGAGVVCTFLTRNIIVGIAVFIVVLLLRTSFHRF